MRAVESLFNSFLLKKYSSDWKSESRNIATSASMSDVIPTSENSIRIIRDNSSESLSIPFQEFCLNFQRLNLHAFLNTSGQGKLILLYYEKHQSLNETMQNYLTQLIIDRELHLILVNSNVSSGNPLKKFSVPSEILQNLASEIHDAFKLRAEIFYNPGKTVEGDRIASVGKFVARINHLRSYLYDAGCLQLHKSNVPKTHTNIASKNLIDVLQQESLPECFDLIKSWNNTFLERHLLSKKNKESGILVFHKYPCLGQSSCSVLIHADFCNKRPDCTTRIDQVWSETRLSFRKFILTKKLVSENLETLWKSVLNSEDGIINGTHDFIILTLLPYALKASLLNASGRVAKKRKTAAAPANGNYEIDNESFLVFIESAEELDGKISKQKALFESNSWPQHPYIVVVGTPVLPSAFFCALENFSFAVTSVLAALELALQISVTYDFKFPKLTSHVWQFLLKSCFRISVKGERVTTHVQQAISFIESDLNINIP